MHSCEEIMQLVDAAATFENWLMRVGKPKSDDRKKKKRPGKRAEQETPVRTIEL